VEYICVLWREVLSLLLLSLTFQSEVVTFTVFNKQKYRVLPTQCTYMFCMDLRTNHYYFPSIVQRSPTKRVREASIFLNLTEVYLTLAEGFPCFFLISAKYNMYVFGNMYVFDNMYCFW
jgi:hypothetical protein